MGVTSAKGTYSAMPVAGGFNYEVLFENTSPVPYDIYFIAMDESLDIGPPPFALKDVAIISVPPGWDGYAYPTGINWGTSFAGSSIASGYIMAGQSGTFAFQSSTAPPKKLPFGCGFYNNANAWGFQYFGIAELVDNVERLPTNIAIYNPWWYIETLGGLVPPGPPDPWRQEFTAALTLAGIASRVSPQLRIAVLELASEQTSIIYTAMKREIRGLKRRSK